MKKNIFLVSLTLFSFCALANGAKVPDDLDKQIYQIIKKSGHELDNLGLVVEESGNVIFSHNADKQFVPASLTKLITAGALLKNVPLNTKFVTQLKSKDQISNGLLKGDLCLEGGGDPSFVSEKMWFLVNEFTRNQVSEISGDLIVDATRFDQENFDVGRGNFRVDRAYDAPISAASFNWNSINIFIRPTEVNKPAKVFLDPENSPIKLKNQSKTVAKENVKSLAVEREMLSTGEVVTVSGNIGKNVQEVVFYKSISQPEMWTGAHLKNFLEQRNIKVRGKIRLGSCATDSVVLATVSSKNFSEMVADMLKFSNNYVAEMLVKNLGALKGIKPSKMNDGIEVLKQYLDELGMKRTDYVLVNVSGLTRDNRFSVNQLNKVLKVSLDDFTIYPEFVSGLAISGIDGTLKSRFKNQENPPLIRAKTGYLDGVVGLSGYLDRKGSRPMVFTFLYNGGYEKALEARNLFDQILIKLNSL